MQARSCSAAILFLVVLSLPLAAQTAPAMEKAKPKAPEVSLYLHGIEINYAHLIPDQPSPHSAAGLADLAAVHAAEAARTPASLRAAQADDLNETIFAYATVLGPKFNEKRLPLTEAFSVHLRHESAVVNPTLKQRFARPRPYRADPTLHLACTLSQADSYPSGHAMVGYLLAFALTQMLPEKSDEILARASDFAHNRLVCGAQYPTDIEASHTIALVLFGNLMQAPSFRAELTAAAAETRAALGLAPLHAFAGTEHPAPSKP